MYIDEYQKLAMFDFALFHPFDLNIFNLIKKRTIYYREQ
jgi:hypothetical protein